MMKRCPTISGLYFTAVMIGVFALLCCIPVQSAVAANGGCRQATQLYDEAKACFDNQERIRLLEKAADICPNFDSYFQLGDAYEKEKKV